VFRHGRLRLYLLKLLEEAPRHGYEVIRLLQDRFLGVYSPSPGTIYPRLTRLEDEGLVTHDEVDGKKVYRITEKGRQELENRFDELAELEEELTASARDIAREIGRDVRDTVRSLREELGRAAARGGFNEPGAAARPQASDGSDRTRLGPSWFGEPGAARLTDPAATRLTSDQTRLAGAGPDIGSAKGRGPWPPPASWPDLERLATDFAKEIQSAAVRARSGLDEGGLRDLRGILADALTRIRTEVFGPVVPTDQAEQAGPAGQADPAGPIDAAGPTDATDPAGSTDATDTAGPVDAAGPADAADPADQGTAS